jgi:thymidine phosphorylase
MSAAATLLRPLLPTYDAAVAQLREELLRKGEEHNAPAYAILRITTETSAYIAGSVGNHADVTRELRALARHGGSFELVEQSGDLAADDFAVAA